MTHVWIPGTEVVPRIRNGPRRGKGKTDRPSRTDVRSAIEADIEVRERDGDTPMILAADRGHSNVAAVLPAHGAKVNARDNQGRTALYHASAAGHDRIAGMLGKRGGQY
jgi:hypothetical protein